MDKVRQVNETSCYMELHTEENVAGDSHVPRFVFRVEHQVDQVEPAKSTSKK